MNNLEKWQKLDQLEFELTQIIQKDRKNWVRVAKLLIEIEQKGLFILKAKSFTRYVSELAIKNRINVSTFWRAKSAIRIYMEIAKINSIELLNERAIKTTPEQLELYSKVRTIVPEKIITEIKRKILKGENVRHELKSLWKTYQPLKKGVTERGRKKKKDWSSDLIVQPTPTILPYADDREEEDEKNSSTQFEQLVKDLGKMKKFKFSSEELVKANILNALQSRTWLQLSLDNFYVEKFRTYTDISFKPKLAKLDLMCFALTKVDKQIETHLFGVQVATSLQEISSFIKTELFSYSNHNFLAIPLKENFISIALEKAPKEMGIIAIGETIENGKHEIKMVRRAAFHKIEADFSNKVYRALLLQTLGW